MLVANNLCPLCVGADPATEADRKPVCVLTKNGAEQVRFDEAAKVSKFLLDAIGKAHVEKSNPMELQKAHTIDDFYNTVGMPTLSDTSITVYEVRLAVNRVEEKDVPEYVIRFVPGDHRGESFLAAAVKNVSSVVENLAKTLDRSAYEKWREDLNGSDTYMRALPCGVAVVQVVDGQFVLAAKDRQRAYSELRWVARR